LVGFAKTSIQISGKLEICHVIVLASTRIHFVFVWWQAWQIIGTRLLRLDLLYGTNAYSCERYASTVSMPRDSSAARRRDSVVVSCR
jgi:hypothetical protein